MLADERSDAVGPILDDKKIVLGNAFINAIVARETLNDIMVPFFKMCATIRLTALNPYP